MNQPNNESTDLANLCLRLRGGLEFELHEHSGQSCFVMHDPTSSSYFQIGVSEYAFLSVLDGTTSLQQAVEATSYRLGDEALTIRDAIRTSHWLMDAGLATVTEEDGATTQNASYLLEEYENKAQQKIVGQLNPLFIKVPLGNPQPFIKTLSPFFDWICSKAFFMVWMAVVCLSVYRLVQQPTELALATQAIFTPDAWAWMLVTMVGLKLAHELAHGLFCHHYGGRVKETGFVFILFMPIPYVDVTSCWGFSSKWKRIAVATAGMYVEVFLAALAAVAWSFVHDPVWQFHLFNVMLIGSLTTVLFNANFLMRFDGYYILADLLEIPNLYQKGQQFVNGLGRRFLLGMETTPSDHPRGKHAIIRAYGLGAWAWRILICISLSIIAMALFYGFGIALAIGGMALWVGMPIWRFVSQWLDPSSNYGPNMKWIGSVTVPVLAGLIAFAAFVPWPVQVSAPAVVEYEAPAIIRADAAGFVKTIHVAANQEVRSGDVLIELENKELTIRLRQLDLDRKSSLIRSRGFHQNREVAAYQSENASRLVIEDQITELNQKIGSLTLRAEIDGTIVGDELETLPGQYVSEGTVLLKVIDESSKKIVAAVSQDDFETFSAMKSRSTIFVPSYGTRRVAGILNSVDPTANSTVDVRLSSFAGGRLAVRPTSGAASRDDEVELISPRFSARIELSPANAVSVSTGTTGVVRLGQYNETIAQHVIQQTRRWLSNLVRASGL